jgi:K+-transporting ATPase ATPase C chain
MRELRTAIRMLVVLTLLTGVVYPLVVTSIAHTLFPVQAAGSLVAKDGKLIGSVLIGQPFDDPKYFWGRLSATVPSPCNAASSCGSNYGPLSNALRDAVRARVTALHDAGPTPRGPVPVDLITASASGLDPHVSPAAAYYQVPRVARARGLHEAAVRGLVAAHVEGRQFGFLGEPRVNVLRLNLALDEIAAR